MFKVIGGVRAVSHVQCDGRGRGPKSMFKVMRGSEGRKIC